MRRSAPARPAEVNERKVEPIPLKFRIRSGTGDTPPLAGCAKGARRGAPSTR
ncbi:hypothetical protein HMPREF9005_1090, partial [Actinomyces sp. oral taxon 178 str. F0338]